MGRGIMEAFPFVVRRDNDPLTNRQYRSDRNLTQLARSPRRAQGQLHQRLVIHVLPLVSHEFAERLFNFFRVRAKEKLHILFCRRRRI